MRPYDHLLTLYRLEGGTPVTGTLRELSRHLYREAEVYHKRYWEAIQAGSSIERMAEIPEHIPAEPELYCRLDDGLIYRVVQMQTGEDENLLPKSTLSLSRTDRRFEILAKE